MNTENYEQEIDLKDLFFSVMLRWRVLLLAAVLGAVVLGGYKGLRGSQPLPGPADGYEEKLVQYNKKETAFNKTIENIEMSIDEQNQYIAEAPIMQINPYNESISVAEVLVESVDAENVAIDNLLKSYEYALVDGEYIGEVAKNIGTKQRYLKELLSVEGNNRFEGSVGSERVVLSGPEGSSPKGMLYISVVGAERQVTEEVLTAVLEEVEALHTTFAGTIGAHKAAVLRKSVGEQVDTDLLEKQQSVRGNVAALQKSLEDFSEGLGELQVPADESNIGNSVKGITKYLLVGFVAGGFAAVFAACVIYILSDKVVSDKEIVNRYRLKSLGAFSKVSKKRAFDFVDRWIHRLAGDDKIWPDEAIFEMIVTNIANYAGGKRSLFVTGLASQELLDKVCGRLCSELPKVRIESERDMIANASARRKMAESEGVILVEEREISRHSGIQKELVIAGNVGAEVVGVIVG